MAQGPERAFRFKRIKLHNGSVSPAQYPNDLNSPTPSRRMRKRTGRRNADAAAVPDVDSAAAAPVPGDSPAPAPAPAPVPDPDPEGQSQGLAASSPNPRSQSRARKAAKGKSKPKKPGQRSMAEQAHDLNTSATLLNDVQVNQMTMDILCRAGLAQPQPINGPGDGEPQYLIPRDTYMRYMGPMSGDNVYDPPIDPSLLQNDNSTPPSQQTSQRPKPRPLVGRHRTVVPTSMASSAVSYLPMTPPPSQQNLTINQSEGRRRKTADDLAQQEAILNTTLGKREKRKNVKFAD